AALLKGRSAWGETEVVELSVRIDAVERREDNVRLPDDQQFSVRVPCFAEQVVKFGALICDESANENWAKGTILICHDFEWGESGQPKAGDFLVLREERNEYDQASGAMVSYHRCT